MKKFLGLFLTLFTLLGMYKNANAEIIKKADYLILFKNEIDEKFIIVENGGTIKETFPNISAVKAEFAYNPNVILENNKKIKRVEQDRVVKAQDSHQNKISNLKFPVKNQEKKTELTGKGVSVAILDTGIDKDHKALRIKDGISFIENNVDLYAVKVLDSESNGKYSTVIRGIDWAIEHKIKIVLMSLGGTKKSTFFEDAMTKAYQKGVLLVSSAGNKGYIDDDTITYPAKFDSVIAVGALDKNDSRGFLSSKGAKLELMAPGTDILSTWNNGDYESDSGTSMAAAHVVGVAALLFERDPDLTNWKVREIMNKSAIPLGDPFEYGNGKVSIKNSLKMIDTNTVRIADNP
ncbi:S8 family serine peptidase [Paenibacillus larvae]